MTVRRFRPLGDRGSEGLAGDIIFATINRD